MAKSRYWEAPGRHPSWHPGSKGSLCLAHSPWICMVGEMQQPEGKETTAGISERCHFSFVSCQGLLTSARWVTGVNLSWAERRVSSAEVEAVPAQWHPCSSPGSAMCLETLALLSCFQVCRTRTPHSTSSRALRCSGGGRDGMGRKLRSLQLSGQACSGIYDISSSHPCPCGARVSLS